MMGHNWLECTSATGGTGSLSLIPSHGFPLLTAWFSTIRQVRYTILEYNSDPSATNANLIRAEDGWCPADPNGIFSTKLLLRGDPSTVVIASWDGTNLYPQQGSATLPAKQNFGAVSANIRIICSIGAEDSPFFSPLVSTTAVGGSVSFGACPLFAGVVSGAFGYGASATDQVESFPMLWPNCGLYSTATMRLGASTGGATTSSIRLAVYEVSKTGDPGALLADFGQLGGDLNTAPVTLVSAALAQPLFLMPGWYYFAVLIRWTGTNPNASFAAANPLFANPGPLGWQNTSGSLVIGLRTASQTSFLNPAPAATQLRTAGASTFVPVFGLK